MKDITIECSGYSVAADWYEGTSTDKILLALYGYSSKKANQTELVSSIVASTDMSALVFDYSGHGDSPFKLEDTRPAQHFLEVIYAFDWLKDQYPNAEISVMGTSCGGFLATQLTKYRSFDKLILRAPAIYQPNDFYTLNSEINSDSGWAAKDSFRKDKAALANHPLLARASSFSGKTLVVVHGSDEVIPKETTDAYIKAFDAEVYAAEGFSHSLVNMPRDKVVEYQNKISDWLNKV